MESLDRADDHDDAFLRLREVLGAPDRRGWRSHLPRRLGHGSADADVEADSGGLPRTRPRLAALAALPMLGAAAVLLVSIARPAPPVRPLAHRSPESTSAAPAEVSAAEPPAAPDSATLPQQVWPGEDVAAGDDGEVRVGRQRWSVGVAGDVVVIGDWDCDRQPTPAVLRPDTGGFYVFDGWAAPGQPATARKVADVPRAVAAVAAGCGTAVLRTDDGVERRITTEVVK